MYVYLPDVTRKFIPTNLKWLDNVKLAALDNSFHVLLLILHCHNNNSKMSLK